MPTRVLVAHQPAYLPWQGYFARLLDIDTLILLDHVQYRERGWQNRNWIRGHHGARQLLTVPVRTTGRFGQTIAEVLIADPRWAASHWRTIEQIYRRAPFFDEHADALHDIYRRPWTRLADLNTTLIGFLLDAIGLPVRLVRSTSLGLAGCRTAMLVELCRQTGAMVLRVGTGAPRYLDPALLADAGIQTEIVIYHHRPYLQGRHSGFVAGLSTLDALLHCGPATRNLIASGVQSDVWEPATAPGR